MVYLDYNASTPLDQRILPGLIDSLSMFGNPSSAHHLEGQAAGELIEAARSRLASLFGRPCLDVIFTSGATEAAALGIIGAMLAARARPNVVVSTTEHKAIIAAAELGARLTGGELRFAGVSQDGRLELDQLHAILDDTVSVVAVMAANNETGVLGPVSEVKELARQVGALNFVDMTQLLGKGALAEANAAADIAVCSSHKIYGPKGVGAMIASRAVQQRIVPLLEGGGQERGLRGGTHNTQAIVGFGLAAELIQKHWAEDASGFQRLAQHMMNLLRAVLANVQINGDGAPTIPNTLNLRFEGADAEAVMTSMPHISVSSGSACQAASSEPSHVLRAMGRTRIEAEESIRISFGRPTSLEDVEIAAAAIIAAVNRVRELSGAA